MTDDLRPQHLDAIDRATAARVERAAMKRLIAAGDLKLDDVVRQTTVDPHSDAVAGSFRIFEALVAGHRIGDKVARAILLDEPGPAVPGHKRIRDLTDRQRAGIVDRLRQAAPWAATEAAA